MRSLTLISSLAAVLATAIGTTAYAGDIARGKEKAATCAGCHGVNGIGLGAEFPNLAGQKEGYLVKQLQAFKAGTRRNPTMNAMAKTLSNADIQNLAAYFSSLGPAPLALSSPGSAAQGKATMQEFPETTFVTIQKSNAVESFPDATVWAGGPNMLYDAVTPDGKRVLASSPTSGTVYVFDAASGKQLAVLPVGKAPKGVKVSPDGRVAYVSNQGSADVSVIDLEKLTVADTIAVEKGPHNVRFTRDGKTAYVTLQGGAGIGVIDTKARKMVRVIPVPGITGPHNLDLSLDEKTAFVRDFVHNVAVLDLRSGVVKKVIKVGNGHGGIDVTPDGRYAVAGAIGDTFISVIDTRTLAVKNIEVGNGPHGVRASRDGRWIYVTVTKDNVVVIINTDTLKVEKKIAVGKFPFWVAVRGNP